MVMVENVLTSVASLVQQNIDNYRVLQKLSISLNREEITAFIPLAHFLKGCRK